MPTSFIQCRDFNHSFRPYTVEELPAGRGFEIWLRCTRCKSIRKRFLGAYGSISKNKYDYAKGYVLKGMGHLTSAERDLVRLESVHRMLDETSERRRAS